MSCWFCSWCGLSAYDFNLIIFIFVFDLFCFLLSVRPCKATHLLQAPTEPGLVEDNASSARHLGEGERREGERKRRKGSCSWGVREGKIAASLQS